MKILLLGDASNYHRTLSTGLRRLGHDVTVASAGSGWMDTARDIDISRPLPGKAGGILLWLRYLTSLRSRFAGYDAVSLCSQSFINLKPVRIRAIFDFVRRANRSVFYTALGTDFNFVEAALDPTFPLDYTEYMVGGHPAPYLIHNRQTAGAWTSGPLRTLGHHIYRNVDGAVSALYEYSMALPRVFPPHRMAYAGIPIDTLAVEPTGIPDRMDKVRLFLGRHSSRCAEKGTDILEAAARDVVARHPGRAELVIVENRPYDEYLGLMKSAHVVLDQIYSYTPATNALLAMAMGLCTVSGGEEDFYRFIGEDTMRPVINVKPDFESVRAAIEHTVLHPSLLRKRGMEGRHFVEKHNSCETVASRFATFWQNRLEEEARP